MPSILGLSTEVPHPVFIQQDVPQKIAEVFSLDPDHTDKIKKIYENSAIRKRHTIFSDFLDADKSKWNFWGKDYPKTIPGMSQRNDAYKLHAPILATHAAQKAIDDWGGDVKDITHVISISCTGMFAPGIEFELMQSLKLNPSVLRLGINFMGCFGAFKGFQVANAFAKENPKNRVLVVCTELCSLHFQHDLDLETTTANALFADGAAAVIVGDNPKVSEKILWSIEKTHSVGLENSKDKMSWEASDRGFLMALSHQVPVLIGRHIKPFIDNLLHEISYSICDWAIHPGGKSILQAIEKAIKLEKDQTAASWEVLREYGNMSSSTFLFVLKRLQELKTEKEWTLGLGFGPGLSVEGILLKKGKQ